MQITETSPLTTFGKFLSHSGQKFFFKAVRLEHIASPLDLSRRLNLRDRFEKLAQAHTTSLIVPETDADAVIDLAAQAGLCTMVELRVAPTSLLDRRSLRITRAQLCERVRALNGRAGLSGYLIDCPVTQDVLKVHGLEAFRRRLRSLMTALRGAAPESLIAIKHRPSTRACSLLEEDLIYSVVPALSPADLKEYVTGLHNLAEARPIVIEFEQATAAQDDLVACAFGLGAGGVVAPAQTVRSRPRADLMEIRMLTAGELMPFLTLNGSCPPQAAQTPMVSVVICAYNAERTMRPCLESLRRLDYPNYEVVIVDDGSRDRTAEISMDFPEFRLIRQPNRGLSVARNVGMHAARGDLIAYTDSDCVVDPHWLAFMVRTMVEGGFDGCGGPNYAPHETGRIEGCVAASPGAPCHVLTGEDRAEHLAGCNMVFSKPALLEAGGFDPQFTSAGDNVDICWRMLDAGLRLGFCPAAFVWHFRRNTVKAYYGQQRGYGRAEAMLYAKYPDRFNLLGQIKWKGTIPGLARMMPGGGAKRVLWSRGRCTASDRLRTQSGAAQLPSADARMGPCRRVDSDRLDRMRRFDRSRFGDTRAGTGLGDVLCAARSAGEMPCWMVLANVGRVARVQRPAGACDDPVQAPHKAGDGRRRVRRSRAAPAPASESARALDSALILERGVYDSRHSVGQAAETARPRRISGARRSRME